jgi:hypothetical protein
VPLTYANVQYIHYFHHTNMHANINMFLRA